MKFFYSIFFLIFIISCTPKEINTIKYKLRTKEIVEKECKIEIERKKLSKRDDTTSKNFSMQYAKSFNANNRIKRACDPYR